MSVEEQRVLQEIEAKTEKEFRGKLRENKNKRYAVNLIELLVKKIDHIVNFVKNERKVKFSCKAGCGYCCSLLVDLWAPEVFYIANKINKYPEGERAQIIRDLEDYSAKVKGLSPQEHAAINVPCIFLKNSACSIYEFRPSSCRKWHSLDVTACKTPAAGIPGSVELVSRVDAVLRGFAKAYAKNNLSLVRSEFGQALLIALTDESAIDRWMKGEEVFPRIPENEVAQSLFIQSAPKK